jgi:hypothetical protein
MLSSRLKYRKYNRELKKICILKKKRKKKQSGSGKKKKKKKKPKPKPKKKSAKKNTKEKASKTKDAAKDKAKDKANKTKDAAKDKAKDKVNKTKDAAKDAAKGALDDAKSDPLGAMNKLSNPMSVLPEGAGEMLSNVTEGTGEVAEDVAEAVKDGADKVVENVTEAVNDPVGAIGDVKEGTEDIVDDKLNQLKNVGILPKQFKLGDMVPTIETPGFLQSDEDEIAEFKEDEKPDIVSGDPIGQTQNVFKNIRYNIFNFKKLFRMVIPNWKKTHRIFSTFIIKTKRKFPVLKKINPLNPMSVYTLMTSKKMIGGFLKKRSSRKRLVKIVNKLIKKENLNYYLDLK